MLSLLVVGCAGIRNLKSIDLNSGISLQSEPQLWKQQDQSVPFSLNIEVAPHYFEKDWELILTPMVVTTTGQQVLEPIRLYGQRAKNRSGIEVNKKKGYSTVIDYSFSYNPRVNKVKLIVRGTLATKKKESIVQQWTLYNSRIVAQLPSDVGRVDTINDKPFMPGEMQTVLTFLVNTDKIIAGESYMKYFKENLRNVFVYKGAFLTKVTYVASCSPEGPTALNEKLVQQRLQAAINYFDTALELRNYPGYKKEGVVVKKTIPENWQGLYYLIEDSDLANRSAMIEALKAAPNDLQRNKILQKYILRYPIFKNQFLKVLRHVWLTIEYEVPYHKVPATIYPPIGPFSWPPAQMNDE